MTTVVWLTEGTWEACVDAARGVPGDLVLLHVIDPATAEAWAAGPTGLLGRGVDAAAETALASAQEQLLDAAADRLGRAVDRETRHVVGRARVETEVVDACRHADLLICARDGERDRPGPHSLAPPTRFVVDHAPCAVLLVWPGGDTVLTCEGERRAPCPTSSTPDPEDL